MWACKDFSLSSEEPSQQHLYHQYGVYQEHSAHRPLPTHYPLQHLSIHKEHTTSHHPRHPRDHHHPHHHQPLQSANSDFRHNPEVIMRSRCSTFMLTGAALFSGAFTLVTLALAVGTDYWLFMNEPYRVPPDELARFNLTDFVDTSVMIYLRSGLWRVCTINLWEGNRSIPDICIHIDFTQEGTGRMDGAPTCMTIVGAIRVATPLPVAALILALSGIVMSGLGSLKQNGKTIIAAVLFILSGLCLAVGVVLFISAIYDELGYHSQTRGTASEFSYYYGWSFYVAGSAFVSSEFAAVMCVTLYLRHNARVRDMVRIIPGLEEKLEEDLEEQQQLQQQTTEGDKVDSSASHADVVW